MKVLINQSSGRLFVDVVNALAEKDDIVLLCDTKRDMSRLNSKVKTVSISAYNKSSIIKRLLSWIVAAVQAWWIVRIRYSKQELLIVSNPPFANLLTLLLPNGEVSHLIYDIYPDVLVNSNIIKKGGVIHRIWAKWNKKIFREAKHVYTLSEGMADCLSQYVSKENVEVVHCWADTDGLCEVKKEDNIFIERYNLRGKFIVLYSGNLGNTHRVEVLVDAAELLQDNDNIHFVIIGEGGKKKMIQERVLNANIKNVTILPYQPNDMLSHSLGCADIAVVTLDVNSSQLSVPSKTFNLMHLGKPIFCIGSKDSELGRLIKDHKIGVLCHPDNVNEIAFYIKDLANNQELLDEYKRNSKKASMHYSSANAYMFLPQ